MKIQGNTYDAVIIGGGINGVSIARDAAGRGLRVLLVERGDLGGATSSASSKLVHGGLRYLEQYAFRLVRESLREREIMLAIAPHIAWPMTFVLPHAGGPRPAWMLRAGLWLYDHMGKRQRMARSRSIDLSRDPLGRALGPGFQRGFAYQDGWVDDARLVVLTARDAADRGADIRPRTACVRAARGPDRWTVTLSENGHTETVTARAVVNAAGPWVADVDRDVLGLAPAGPVRLVQGSHIIVPRLYRGDHAHILTPDDGRVVFVLPYEGDFTLIGTTEVDLEVMPDRPRASATEIDYLCRAASRFMARAITPGDVVTSFAGVRALLAGDSANATKTSRDYVLKIQTDDGAPALSVYGGKLTTARRLGEKAVDKLKRVFPHITGYWTAAAPLPGGDFSDGDFDAFLSSLKANHSWLPPVLARRYAHAYGTQTSMIVGKATSLDDLGADMGGLLFEAELRYLVTREWAQTSGDILWRRTKLGLHTGPDTAARLDAWLSINGATSETERTAHG
ncbi:MAG: glycerol-3-phosphate dehydrogenase [Sphingomonadales bacterium]